eukprot:Colp12_sorted_trinity150504_noHs@3552
MNPQSKAVAAAVVVGVAAAAATLVALYFKKKATKKGEKKEKKEKKEGGEKSESTLYGTVNFYERHVFIGTALSNWPSHIEDATEQEVPLAAEFARLLKQHKPTRKTKLSATDAAVNTIVVLPDKIMYTGVTSADLPLIVTQHLSSEQGIQLSDGLSAGCRMLKLEENAQHIYVCTHNSRDERCGRWGPQIIASLKQELAQRGLEHVTVNSCSHVGGHVYAGNVIIYGRKGADGELIGDWYGNVRPEHAAEIVSEHVVAGKVLPRLWRGRMGATAEQQVSEFKACDNCDCGRA